LCGDITSKQPNWGTSVQLGKEVSSIVLQANISEY
jgi:hypothetical protein